MYVHIYYLYSAIIAYGKAQNGEAYLIENAVRERPKTVRADEARLMPGLPVRVDDFFVRLEAFPTAMA